MRPVTHRLVRTNPALAHRDFARYLLAQTVSGFGTWFQTIAQVLLVLDLTDSGTALGVATALQYLPMLVLTLYAGLIVDRVGARAVLLVTSIASGLLALGLGIITAAGAVSVGWIWVFSGALGVAIAFDRPATGAVLGELVPLEHRSNANALNSVQMASGRLVGPAAAAVLYAAFGPEVCFLLNAASYLVVIWALSTIGTSSRRVTSAEPQRVRDDLRDGLRYVRVNPHIRAPLVTTALIGLLAFNFLTVMPAMVRFVYDAGPTALGIAEALNAGAAVIGGLWLAPRLGSPDRHSLAVANVVFTVGIVVPAVMPWLWAFYLWMPVFGMCFIFWQTRITSALQHHSAPAYLGRVMSLYTLAIFGTTPFGALIAGALIDHVSTRAAFGMGALSTTAAALWLWFAQPADLPATGGQ